MSVTVQRIEPHKVQELLGRRPDPLPIVPLRGMVVYPLAIVSLEITGESSALLIDDALRNNTLIGLVAQRNPDVEQPGPADLYTIGTIGRVLHVVQREDGGLVATVQGLERIGIQEYTDVLPYPLAKAALRPDAVEETAEVQALARTAVDLFLELAALADYVSPELADTVSEVEDVRQLAYLLAANLPLSTPDQQSILAEDPLPDKLRLLAQLESRELEVLRLTQRIRAEVEQRLSRAQREYLLREQLRAVQRELGELDQQTGEAASLQQRLAQARLPEAARQEAERELGRLSATPTASPEFAVIRTYLDWLLSLPWDTKTGGPIDVERARQILDDDHCDIDQVKERILEYLAVRKLKEERTGEEPGERQIEAGPEAEALREPILCLVGPPGVGKTSLGQSIARAMGRKFVRVSLGGVRDEAEIRGHRRTYVGALPGRIVEGIRRVGAKDAVFMLDEIDKLAVGFQGDPAAALLEVLDPAQNHSFTDHYLGVPFDLTQVLFITTANTTESIPAPLLDRMEVLQLPGYSQEEKVAIAERFLVPKQRRAHGLRAEEIRFTSAALARLEQEYTHEAGVRNLERQIAAICRKVARDVAAGTRGPVVVTPEALPSYLGPPRRFYDLAERTSRPGVATGLAWTPTGGQIIFIEAAMMPGRQARLILTGQLGEVMRESALAALTYLRSNSQRLGIDPTIFEQNDLHIHVPAGAIPKDGPSAGITLAVALCSLLTGRPARPDVALTGEVTLRGAVLPVGGIRDKVLAAQRAGIKRIVLPKRNEPDLSEVPENPRLALEYSLVESIDEALAVALCPAEEGAAGTRREDGKTADQADRLAA